VIQAEQIFKYFGNEPSRVTAVEDLNLTVEAGAKISIVGRSGSGKTTLLNLLSGLDRPTSGRLVIEGRELSRLNQNEMADYRLRCVGVVFQSFQLIPQRTAAQNVELPLIIRGMPANKRVRIVADALLRVGLEHRASHFPYALSGGEQQRVAIARAIVKRPSLLLADEPTGNLDSQTTTEIMQLIMQIAEESNLTLVLVTHDHELAVKYSDRIVTMCDGRMSEVIAK